MKRVCKYCSAVITSSSKHRCIGIAKSIKKATMMVGVPTHLKRIRASKSFGTSSIESRHQDDGFAQSMMLGYSMNNGLVGGAIGGNIAGGIMGDAMNGGLGN